ncbi:MAG TPA: nucleotide pyrophosphatase/phosphodiesterase family protein, partial [Vicinamibacterales bacterium]
MTPAGSQRRPWMRVVLCLLAAAAIVPLTPRAAAHRHLLIIVDGLRPDYVTPEVMPNLTDLGKRGVVFRRHHSVYPTVTRVNASTISTGAYPEAHGLMGNSVYFPAVDRTRFLDTADKGNLLKIAAAEGRLLTAPTLAEALEAAGRRMLVVSSGSSGSAFLNNSTLAGGAILHYQFAIPERLAGDLKELGPPPPEKARGGELDRYAVDTFLKVGVPRVDPSVTVMWLSDLDTAAHDNGIGAPATVATLRRVDENIGRIQEALKAAGLLDDYDIWVSSDHGFSTYTGAPDVASILRPFARTMP